MSSVRSAFTMIELMIAIVIIAILAAITLSIGSAVLESADRRKTQDVLALLDAAMTEYEQHVGSPLTYGQGDGDDFDVYQDRPIHDVSKYDIPVMVYAQHQPAGIGFLEDFSVDPGGFDSWESAVAQRAGRQLMAKILERLNGMASSQKILARISPSFWQDMGTGSDPTFKILVDAWGRPIVPGAWWCPKCQIQLQGQSNSVSV